MSKQFLAIIAAIVLFFVGIIVFAGEDKKPLTPTNHVLGNSKSTVTLVEYGDYQCPHCFDYKPVVDAVLEEYKDRIKFQFRHFPIVSAHPNAFAAARAAEAAGLQGKFWEMHDMLYSPVNWQRWTAAQSANSFFNDYAKQLDLDMAKFKTDFASTQVNDKINGDLQEAEKLGVKSTPTFFLNGKQIQINKEKAAFEKVLDQALAKSKAAEKASTRANQNQ